MPCVGDDEKASIDDKMFGAKVVSFCKTNNGMVRAYHFSITPEEIQELWTKLVRISNQKSVQRMTDFQVEVIAVDFEDDDS